MANIMKLSALSSKDLSIEIIADDIWEIATNNRVYSGTITKEYSLASKKDYEKITNDNILVYTYYTQAWGDTATAEVSISSVQYSPVNGKLTVKWSWSRGYQTTGLKQKFQIKLIR